MSQFSSTIDRSEPQRVDDRTAVLRALLVRVLVVGGAISILTLAALCTGGFIILWEMIQELKAARQAAGPNNPINMANVLGGRTDLFVGCIAIGVGGLLSAFVGHFSLRKVLGPDRQQPHRLSLVLFLLPFALGGVSMLASSVKLGWGFVWFGALVIGAAGASVTPQLTVLLTGMLAVVSSAARRRFSPTTAGELSPDDVAALARYDDQLREQGFTFCGYFIASDGIDHIIASWRFPNLPSYLHVARYHIGEGADYLSATALTSDGHYFETSTAPDALTASVGDARPFHHQLTTTDPAEVAEFHRAKILSWIEATGEAIMEVQPAEIPAAEEFGLAHLGSLIRERGQKPLLWLADPYLGFDQPPLPGRPWDPTSAEEPVGA